MGDLNAEDEELMGTLDLIDFLPTNEELANEADLNRLGSQSITDLDVPKLSHETVHKLEHFGHQDVSYQNGDKQAQTVGFPHDGDGDEDDLFRVDFDGDGGSRGGKALAATAPVKMQTGAAQPPHSTAAAIPTAAASAIDAQPASGSRPAATAADEEEEEEEELLVVPSSQRLKAAVAKAPEVEQTPAEFASAASSPTKPLASAGATPPQSVQKEKSRDDTLPGKLQKKVSEARLLQTAAADAVTDDELQPPTREEEEEMMTDIEELLLRRDRSAHLAAPAGALGGAVAADDAEEEADEFEIAVDDARTRRGRHLRPAAESPGGDGDDRAEDGAFADDDARPTLAPKQHGGQEPQPAGDSDARQRARKSKLLVSQERGEDGAADPSKRERPYQHPMSQGRFVVGSRTLTMAEAKLYGLVDAEGRLVAVSSAVNAASAAAPKVPLKRLSDMARPRSPAAAPSPEEDGYTFQPQRSASALKAMKNPKLGYDFVDRLQSGGGFLQRLDKDNHKKIAGVTLSKAEQAAMEEDYNARLDKLTCPSCAKEQSFDEFLERSRLCRLCGVKYVKAHVSSGLGFVKQNAKREADRQKKLQQLEREMYGDVGVTKTVASKSRPASAATATLPTIPVRAVHSAAARKLSPSPANALAKPPTPGDQSGAPPPSEAQRPRPQNRSSAQPQPPAQPKPAAAAANVSTRMSSNQNASEAVDKMRQLHNRQADELSRVLTQLTAAAAPSAEAAGAEQRAAASGAATGKQRDSSVGRKMDRLLHLD
eukprot:gene13343-9552_t